MRRKAFLEGDADLSSDSATRFVLRPMMSVEAKEGHQSFSRSIQDGDANLDIAARREGLCVGQSQRFLGKRIAGGRGLQFRLGREALAEEEKHLRHAGVVGVAL